MDMLVYFCKSKDDNLSYVATFDNISLVHYRKNKLNYNTL